MAKDFDRLEGTYKLSRLKKLEKYAIIPQMIGIIVLFFLLIYIGNPQLKPFYLPLYWPILIMFIWLLIVSLLKYGFRLMEIRYRDSESAKFLMANRSMKKAYTISIVALIVFSLTVVPFFPQQLQNVVSDNEELSLINERAVEFTSRGRFDFLKVEKINVRVKEVGVGHGSPELEIFVLSKNNYEAGQTEFRLNQHTVSITPDMTFEFNMPDVKFGEYVLWLRTDRSITVEYEIQRIIPHNRLYLYTLLSLGFLISNVAWANTLYPIKKKHSDKAIYE
ncbi:MAG: hypothetical protein ACOC85_00040 [Thermoplasmatota archaeon]